MDTQTFINLAKAYRDLGNAVADQLDDVLNGAIEGTNPNALKLLVRFLDRCDGEVEEAAEVREEIAEFLASDQDKE